MRPFAVLPWTPAGLHRYAKHNNMRLIVTDVQCSVCLSVCTSACLCVCLLVITVSPTKAADPIEVPFKAWTRVDPRNHVLDLEEAGYL